MTSASHAGAATAVVPQQAPQPWLRQAVRDVLSHSVAFSQMPANDRRALAQAMVQVSSLAAQLVQQEQQAEQQIQRTQVSVRALEDQPGFGTATRSIGQTTRDTLNAISFPRFVTDLINGVFRAMNDSSQTQMNQFLQLLNAVSGSAAGFEATSGNEMQARQWVAEHFPDQIEVETTEPTDPRDGPPDPEDVEPPRLRLIAGQHMPEPDAIRTTLGLAPNQEVSADNPEALVPFARRALARQRQQMLATMVQMGMSRIVIDEGKINAAMRFHIDTRSAAAQDRANQFGMQNRVRASGSFGAGPWGVSAEVENTISYVNTERNQRSEEINTSADLTSSVELHFHTDSVPLNRLAAQAQADRVRQASLNPSAELEIAHINERQQRRDMARQSDDARRTNLNSAAGGVAQPTMRDAPLPTPTPEAPHTAATEQAPVQPTPPADTAAVVH